MSSRMKKITARDRGHDCTCPRRRRVGNRGLGRRQPRSSGPNADKAKAAALAHLGGGTANSVERDNENGATWEVEVTKNGKTVDVRLDAAYKVIVVEGDSEQNDGQDGGQE